MNSEISIRIASPDDAASLVAIYAPYVENTAITFEYTVPSVPEFRQRIITTLQKYPYLVAEQDHQIVGYAYLSPFVGRAAYDWAAETSIYVAQHCKHQGIGKLLYQALENICHQMGILNLNACISYPKDANDPHLNHNSPSFHQHLGYRLAGHFHDCGYKFDRWYDMIWMEKMLAEHPAQPQAIKPFPAIKDPLQFNH